MAESLEASDQAMMDSRVTRDMQRPVGDIEARTAPQGAAALDEDDNNNETTRKSHHGPLARRWSTPVRIRASARRKDHQIDDGQEDSQQADPPASLNNIAAAENCHQQATAGAAVGAICGGHMRHSHHRGGLMQTKSMRHAPPRHKSISSLRPTSSSASDSAFSQSQTTLGSDFCGDSEGRAQKCVADRLSATSDASSSSASSQAGSGSSGASESHAGQPPEGDHHFKIVWRKLSYRIPEKRYSRALAYVHKLREMWLARGVDDDEGPVPDDDDDDVEVGDSAPPGDVNSNFAPPHISPLGITPFSKPITTTVNHKQLESGLASSTHAACGGGGGTLTPAAKAPRLNHLKLAKLHKQRTSIFSNLNGCVRSGQLTAILGPSGAGKTTFLKCLTNSITKGVSGSITIHSSGGGGLGGGRESPTSSTVGVKSSQHLKLCIIPQKDYLFDNLTVMENLLFASRIKNTQAHFDHEENVYRISNLLGLLACLKLKTGRLSGGQYKRVSIAQELLAQPDILILDEPTSGLDSLTCFRTVSVLRDLADMSQAGLMPPLAIVMTIHQPQVKIFQLFHHVYVLSALGQCVYEGRPGYLLDTVEASCKLLPPPDDQNPASFIIDIASEVYGARPVELLRDLQQENFELLHTQDQDQEQQQQVAVVASGREKSTPTRKQVVGNNAEQQQQQHQLVISNALRKRHDAHENNFWLHTRLLVGRHWTSTWRDSLLTKTRVIFHLVIPFVFYCVYSQKSGSANACPHVERELDIQDMVSDSNIERLTVQHDELILTFENLSLFFILLYSFSMCVLALTALSFPLNMQILLKETANGWYTGPRFVMAKTLADLPIELTMPAVSVAIAYTLTGQPASPWCWRMLAVTAIMTLCSLISQTQGLLYGAWFMNNVQAAVFVSQATSLPWIMLSGFTTRVSHLPQALRWLSFASIYRLGIESIMSVRYGYGMCPCDAELVNETNTPRITGIPEHLKSVMSYYLDLHSASVTEAANTTHTQLAQSVLPTGAMSSAAAEVAQVGTTSQQNDDIFSKLAATLTRANTYGVNIVSCEDVKPFILTAREVDETTLPLFLAVLVAVLLALKVLLFHVVKQRTSS